MRKSELVMTSWIGTVPVSFVERRSVWNEGHFAGWVSFENSRNVSRRTQPDVESLEAPENDVSLEEVSVPRDLDEKPNWTILLEMKFPHNDPSYPKTKLPDRSAYIFSPREIVSRDFPFRSSKKRKLIGEMVECGFPKE